MTPDPITRFIKVKDVVTPYKTLEKAAEEASDYGWMRAGDNVHICQHGEQIYPLILREIDGVPEIACGCPAWQFAHDNDGCKHTVAFLKRSTPPQKPITDAIARDLMAAGWTGGKGDLRPPEMTSDEDGVDNEGTDPVPDRAPKPTPAPAPEQKETPKMSNETKQIIEEAEALGVKVVDAAYVDEKLATLTRFRVTGSEAIRSVVSGILRAQGIKRPKGEGGSRSNELVAVDTIKTDGSWINLRAKVVDLWQNEHESIRQVGLIGDETGTTKFVSWEKANLPTLEEGKCYSIENVVTKEYEGTFSVAFNKTTTISEIEDDIAVGFSTSEYAGILVAMQKGSGLIKRCTICNRAMQNGTCKEHGTIEGIRDLRIRAVLDDGLSAQNILLNRERTEELAGILLDDAIKMAQDALDAGVVAERISDMLIGKEYSVSGRDMGDTILVESMGLVETAVTKEMIEELKTGV